MRAKGLGAEVIVTEIDPIKAMEAVMDGFKVMKMEQAAEIGDIFVTVTGCDGVIVKEHFLNMKDGAICCNAGHFDCEVDVAGLKKMAIEAKQARNNIMEYKLENGKRIYIIAEGRLVNLAAGDGHPAEIMDMSFAIQALSAKYLVENRDKVSREPGSMVNDVPLEIDREVAARKLAYWGCEIDTLTPEQHNYLFGE
jgi:adenosylhomocysteinase